MHGGTGLACAHDPKRWSQRGAGRLRAPMGGSRGRVAVEPSRHRALVGLLMARLLYTERPP
jgi:hypothetical protein